MPYIDNELIRHQIDRLLRMQAKLCVNLGIDSSVKEKKEVNKKIAIMDRMIRKADRTFFPSIDSTK
jgi:hypothetical protein